MSDPWDVDRLKIGPGLIKKGGRLDVNINDPRRKDPTLTVPVVHGYTHGPDGGDPVSIAIAQVIDLLETLAGKVDTDDERLSDARDPTAHHASHEDGGSDELTLAMSQITGLLAALAAILPAYSVPADAYKLLGIQGDGSLTWIAVAGAEFPFNYDASEDYDSAFTYDEEFIS